MSGKSSADLDQLVIIVGTLFLQEVAMFLIFCGGLGVRLMFTEKQERREFLE